MTRNDVKLEKKIVVYVAGAYRASTPWRVQAHVRAAMEVALAVWKAGAVALCPHANTAMFDGEAPDDVWLAGDLELLSRCDAMLTVPGWKASKGAMAEVEFANLKGIPVYHAIEGIAELVQLRNTP